MKLYRILLIFTILAAVGGILTMIPWSGASYPNVLGYKSLCTFAPSATFFCFLAAGISCFIRATFIKESSGSVGKKIRKHRHSLFLLLLMALLAIYSMVWFLNVKAEYTSVDTTSAATVESEESEY